MYPILFELFGVPIYSFSVVMAFAIVGGLFYFWHKLHGKVFPEDRVFDMAFAAIAAGFVGARLGYVLMHPLQFFPDVLGAFAIFTKPGFSYYGALIGGSIALVSIARKHKLPAAKYLDVAALAAAFAHVVGLLGAFLGSVAYGEQTNLPWGVPMAGLEGKRHPTQLLEAVLELGLAFFLYKVLHRDHKDGIIAVWYVVIYSMIRLLVEFFRGDGVYLAGVPVMMLVCIASVAITLVYAKKRLRF